MVFICPPLFFLIAFSIMIRNAPRRRVLFVVVIALVGLMAAPIDECDDYAFFRTGPATAHAGLPEEARDDLHARPCDGNSHLHVCSCLVCVLTTDDAFAPRLPAPQRGEKVSPLPVAPVSTGYLPAIYHPPIS
jgi:hypothetical protein